MIHRARSSLVCSLALLAGCPSEPIDEPEPVADAGSAQTVCTPGEVSTCDSAACPDGASAQRVCLDDGSGYGACACDDVPSDCPQADHFLDVASAPGPDENGLMPELSVECTDTEIRVTTNDIPHYTFLALTPSALVENRVTHVFPRYPEVAESPTRINEGFPQLGSAGVTNTGLSLNAASEGPTPDPYGDPIAAGILDPCGGHTGQDYHNHTMMEKCFTASGLVAEPWNNADPDPSQPSPVLGYALDGFPVYGNRGCADAECSRVVSFKSSWENQQPMDGTIGCVDSAACNNVAACDDNDPRNNAGNNCHVCALTVVDGAEVRACIPKDYAWDTNAYVAKDGEQYLDECNGRVQPDGSYGYHITDTFPYWAGCYRGTPVGGSNGGGNGGGGNPGGGGGQPPQAAVDACDGLSAGDACSFEGRGGERVTGVCGETAGGLACRPQRG